MNLSYVNGATLLVAGGWVALLFSNTVATHPWVATPVLLVAYPVGGAEFDDPLGVDT